VKMSGLNMGDFHENKVYLRDRRDGLPEISPAAVGIEAWARSGTCHGVAMRLALNGVVR
jgi:hypothetical protein